MSKLNHQHKPHGGRTVEMAQSVDDDAKLCHTFSLVLAQQHLAIWSHLTCMQCFCWHINFCTVF